MPRPRKNKELVIPDSIKSLQPIAETREGRFIYEDNPFIQADKFVVLVNGKSEVIGKDLTITDKTTDEISSGVIVRQKTVDTDLFVKLYSKNVSLFFDLSATAQKVLISIILAVQDQSKDKAEIYLSYEQAVKYYQNINYDKIPTKVVFSRGITSLIDAEFIAYHWRKNGWYWINPNILFNGDRISFIESYKLRRKEEKRHLPLPPAQQSLIDRHNPLFEHPEDAGRQAERQD